MKKLITAGLSFAPLMALAQTGGVLPPGPTFQETSGGLVSGLKWFSSVLTNYIIPIIITLALILFLWGLISYITAGADEEKRTNARNYMIYGIIALFVMVSVWGLVAILNRTFGIRQGGSVSDLPEVPGIGIPEK